jgi:hypothetical protein
MQAHMLRIGPKIAAPFQRVQRPFCQCLGWPKARGCISHTRGKLRCEARMNDKSVWGRNHQRKRNDKTKEYVEKSEGDVMRERRISDISFARGGASIPLHQYRTNILFCQEGFSTENEPVLACRGNIHSWYNITRYGWRAVLLRTKPISAFMASHLLESSYMCLLWRSSERGSRAGRGTEGFRKEV